MQSSMISPDRLLEGHVTVTVQIWLFVLSINDLRPIQSLRVSHRSKKEDERKKEGKR